MAIRAKKYLQDYDVETTQHNGKTKIRYVYKGDLYVRELSASERNLESVVYILVSILAGVLLLTAMRKPVAVNIGGIFAGLSLLALIPAFCVLEGSVEAFFRRGELKTENYRERLLMLRVMPFAGMGLDLLLAAGYLYNAFLRNTEAGAAAQAMACALAAAAIYAGVAVREIKVRYRVIKGARSSGSPDSATDALDLGGENDE